MSTVSVIIPLHNEETLLPKCLDSVLGQTYPNIEVILINDGSTDDSPSICDMYAKHDNRIKVIHQNSMGVSVARNAGLDCAAGKYIQFIDADDYVLPDMTRVLVETMESEKVDTVVCGLDKETVQDDGTSVLEPMRILPKGRFTLSEYLALFADSYDFSPVAAITNKLFTKRLIDDHRLRFKKNVKQGEDSLFCCEYLAVCTDIFVANQRLYRYVFGNTPEMFTSWNRYHSDGLWFKLGGFIAIDRLVRGRVPEDTLHRTEGILANLLAGALVSHCRRDATLPHSKLLRDIEKAISLPDVRQWLKHCRPLPGKSRLMPLLMRLRWTKALFFLARRKADQRFGRFYPVPVGAGKASISPKT